MLQAICIRYTLQLFWHYETVFYSCSNYEAQLEWEWLVGEAGWHVSKLRASVLGI